MGKRFDLFDTNIIIDYLNGVGAALTVVTESQDRSISVITWIEVMAGTTPSNREKTRTVLDTFVVIKLDSEIAEQTARVRQQTRLKLRDAMILATAQRSGLTLVTRNIRDFRLGQPGIHVPYQL